MTKRSRKLVLVMAVALVAQLCLAVFGVGTVITSASSGPAGIYIEAGPGPFRVTFYNSWPNEGNATSPGNLMRGAANGGAADSPVYVEAGETLNQALARLGRNLPSAQPPPSGGYRFGRWVTRFPNGSYEMLDLDAVVYMPASVHARWTLPPTIPPPPNPPVRPPGDSTADNGGNPATRPPVLTLPPLVQAPPPAPGPDFGSGHAIREPQTLPPVAAPPIPEPLLTLPPAMNAPFIPPLFVGEHDFHELHGAQDAGIPFVMNIPVFAPAGDLPAWALANLILSVLGIILAAAIIVRSTRQNRGQSQKPYRLIVVCAAGVGGVALFVLTQTIGGATMVLLNFWSPVHIALAGIIAMVGMKKHGSSSSGVHRTPSAPKPEKSKPHL